MLRRLFPGGFSNSPYNSFKLVLVAAGYLANETACFIGDCVDLVEALFNTAPFSLTRAHPGRLGVYPGFTASTRATVTACRRVHPNIWYVALRG